MIRSTALLVISLCLACFVASQAALGAIPEIPGDGFDDSLATGGTAAGTYGSCPSGYMNSVKGPQGCDHKCLSPDEDCDGYTSDGTVGAAGTTYKDVDDNNRDIIPNEFYACNCGSGTNTGYRKAQTDGTYGACTCNATTPLCEKTAISGATCYYIDCGSGSDSYSGADKGSYSHPFASWGKVSGGSSGTLPTGSVTLTPGSVVYLKGTTNCSMTSINGGALGNSQGDFTVSGTSSDPITLKQYPGATAELVLNDIGGFAFNGLGASNAARFNIVDGLTFTGTCVHQSYNNTPVFSHADDLEVRRIYVHDWLGNTYNNGSGVYSNGTNRQNIHHNFFKSWRQGAAFTDCHNNTNTGDIDGSSTGGNIQAIKLLDNVSSSVGQNQSITFNSMLQTNGNNGLVEGGCFFYKHGISANDAGNLGTEVRNNFCVGTNFYKLTGSKNRVTHNFVYGGYLVVPDLGDSTHPAPHEDNLFEYNTIYGGGLWSGSIGYISGITDEKATVRYNVVYDTASSYNTGANNGMYSIDGYGSDANLAIFEANNGNSGTLFSDNNCFYNPNTTAMFDYYGETTNGAAGGFYTLSQWQALNRPEDVHSSLEDPSFDVFFRPTSSHCSDKGWTAPKVECDYRFAGSAIACY